MSVRRRRCLSAVAVIAWLVWLPAFAASLVMDVGKHHILAQYGALAIAVTSTLCLVVVTTVAPTLAALRALIASASHECPKCVARRQTTTIRLAPMTNHVRSDC